MLISSPNIQRECEESEVYTSVLPLAGARIAELGCGAAQNTMAIAAMDPGIEITAYEVDRIQHQKNLKSEHGENVSFKLAGAQAIPEPDQSFDIVTMFKSLHHVSREHLKASFEEIHRVLKPGGVAYISEPIFAGEFNDILRLFHDEEIVRQAAFDALVAAVNTGLFENDQEIFFNSPVRFDNFADFENKIIKATHSDHRLDEETMVEVKSRFEEHVTASGVCFTTPMRINLLRKVN